MQRLTENLLLYGIEYKENEPLSLHSTFRIGGNTDCAVFPKNEQELVKCLTLATSLGIRYCVVGRASNILFDDAGYRGMIVFTAGMSEIRVDGTSIYAGAGASTRQIASVAAEHGLAGFAWAHGIPGSLGGAIYMNAGAFGGNISGVLGASTCFCVGDGSVRMLDAGEHRFGNKHSVYMDTGDVILGGRIDLFAGDREEILCEMRTYTDKRAATQPLNFPSAGSYFKRPEGYFAGKLIEDCGLKGFCVGGAEVSKKHAGFIVNRGGATSRDVLCLAESVQKTVMENFGVALEPEVRYIKP